ncbi:hypothetical protein JVT61DRAFT_3207 [Boletus reticuloceps]|uniref:Uncharacterized protein n=1 Tax=Boletus reticuloceps TaxID=495285 RepID=A0A8I2YMM3_9AGAM|nr:hypothetical protein JVT61DRAFT_3207 [Boletus reticuloceps]
MDCYLPYHNHPSTHNVTTAAPLILSALLKVSHNTVSDWAHIIVQMQCVQELRDLGSGEHDWKFNALHARSEQIECFQIGQITREIEQDAPRLWILLEDLLARARRPDPSNMAATEVARDLDEDDEESEYWNQVDDIEGIMEGIAGTNVSRAAYLTVQ